ncbi:MAG TPA: ABC transporter permease [Methanobacterium subterraneum]|uniref:ABC transporter permease n=1 Tax=Methanobacterium subterraneum TaxID=59277 RepID=A0A7J4THR8_9EURY|nr:ABC transporter permease [Methanobacterium subterraneum]
MRFLSLASRNLKEIYRDPLSIAFGVAMPAVFLILFISISKNAPIGIFTANGLTPAVAVFSFGFLTLFSAMLLAKDRESAFLTRLLTTPLTSLDFISAYILPFLPIAVLQITICFAIGSFYGVTINSNLLFALIIIFTMALGCIGLEMIIGSLFTEKQAPGVSSIVIVFISIFGGCWMDLKMVGGIFGTIGYTLPFAYAIDAARAVLNGSGFFDIVTDFYWVLGYTLIFFFVGIFCFRWRTKG